MENFIKNLAKGAGEILKKGFNKELRISYKTAARDVVTQYDLESDKFIINRIRKKFPSHGILTEESGNLIKRKNFWLIDPLDGTFAFARGLAQFCVSIAFVENNKLKLAAIYEPMLDELFFAKSSGGAWLNGKKISVSSEQDFDSTLGSIIIRYSSTKKGEAEDAFKQAIRRDVWLGHAESSALTLAYTAAGRFDFALLKGCYPWDYAAGGLILKEAGAIVTESNGKAYTWKSDSILGANEKMHKKILREFKLK